MMNLFVVSWVGVLVQFFAGGQSHSFLLKSQSAATNVINVAQERS